MGLMVSVQLAVQAALCPAMWIPGLRNTHHEVHEWHVGEPCAALMDKVWAAAAQLEGGGSWSQWELDKARGIIVLNYLTRRLRWLDQVELQFEAGGAGSSVVRVRAYSTGMLPLLVPFAPLLNALLCWVPFSDAGGKCGKEIAELRLAVAATVKQLASTVVMFSLGNPQRFKALFGGKRD